MYRQAMSRDYWKGPEKKRKSSKTRRERAQNNLQLQSPNLSIDQYETHNSFRHQFTKHKVVAAGTSSTQAAEIKPEHEKLANKSLRTIQ